MHQPETPFPSPDGADSMRSALRAGVRDAMQARDRETLSALRTAIAAIDNAEAIDPGEGPATSGSDRVAGAHPGVGSTEVERRTLTAGEVDEILRGQVAELVVEADRYVTLGQHEAAARLRREAAVVEAYLDG